MSPQQIANAESYPVHVTCDDGEVVFDHARECWRCAKCERHVSDVDVVHPEGEYEP